MLLLTKNLVDLSITKDGVTVAKEIELEMPIRKHGSANGKRSGF